MTNNIYLADETDNRGLDCTILTLQGLDVRVEVDPTELYKNALENSWDGENPTTEPVLVNLVTSDVWRLIEMVDFIIETASGQLDDTRLDGLTGQEDAECLEADISYLNEIKTKLEKSCPTTTLEV